MNKLDLDPRLEGREEQHADIPSVNSLNNNQSNVIVVGLNVAVFKKIIGLETNNATDLLAMCGSVATLVLSAWLRPRGQPGIETHKS